MHRCAKVLLITEGKIEEKFFKQIAKVFGFAIEIVQVKSNIYTLYNYLKKYDFQCDIKKAVLDISHNLNPFEKIRYKSVLNDKYAYTYLIYDFDVQHDRSYWNQSDKTRIIKENINQVSDMINYFIDETDDTVGKIYVNYPMMESYRDIDSFDDVNYKNRVIDINDLKKYKSLVGERAVSKIHLDKYTKDNFLNILKLNIYKICHINKIDIRELNFYYDLISGKNIFSFIVNRLNFDDKIYVLNSSILFIPDYNDKYLNSCLIFTTV